MKSSCLFWEVDSIGEKKPVIDKGIFSPIVPGLTPAAGRLVTYDNFAKYMYDCLEALGLNTSMRTDFITFWLSKV